MAALRVAARRSIIWKSACVKMEKCGRRSRGACAIEARTRSFDNASVAHNNSGTQISFPLIGNSKVTEQAVDRAPRAVAEKRQHAPLPARAKTRIPKEETQYEQVDIRRGRHRRPDH